SPGGGAADATEQYLAGYLGALVYLEPHANELQIDLAAPLTSGFYEVSLPDFGYSAQFQVAGPAGNADLTRQPGTWTGTAYADPALFVTLGQGEYYLAVSATVNFPNPNDPTDTTFFDPTVPQSGSVGSTTNTAGPYVLNLLIQPAAVSAPHVVAVMPDMGTDGS